MVRADTIKIICPLDCINNINKELFNSYIVKDSEERELGKINYINKRNNHPKILGVNLSSLKLNEINKTFILEFSSKILKERYIELININNIEYAINIFNEYGVINIDANLFLENAEVLIIHVANNILVNDFPPNYITDFCLYRHNQNYLVKNHEHGIVFKSREYSGNHDYLKIYWKHPELSLRKNNRLAEILDLNQFEQVIKVECEITKRKNILQAFGTTKLKAILNHKKNPNSEVFSRISNINLEELNKETDINNILNSGKAKNYIEKEAGRKQICEYYNNDENAIKNNYLSRFKGRKNYELKEYRKIINSVLTKDICTESLMERTTEFKSKLET